MRDQIINFKDLDMSTSPSGHSIHSVERCMSCLYAEEAKKGISFQEELDFKGTVPQNLRLHTRRRMSCLYTEEAQEGIGFSRGIGLLKNCRTNFKTVHTNPSSTAHKTSVERWYVRIQG